MKETYYIEYRGCVTLYTPVEAESEDEARNIAQDTLQDSPGLNDVLILPSADFDFELQLDYITKDLRTSEVPVGLRKQVIKAARAQTATRLKKHKEAKAAQLTKQLEDANKQLLSLTKGVTDNIAAIELQLQELA